MKPKLERPVDRRAQKTTHSREYLMFRFILTVTFGAFTLLALTFTFNAAHASFATLLADKHWQQSEAIDPVLQNTVCQASTSNSDHEGGLELLLSYPKDGALLPILALKTKTSAPLIAIKLSSRESEPMFLLQAAATPEEVNTYWYAPLNFPQLEKLIRAKNQLEIFLDPKGSSIPVKISLSGSANAIDAAKKCVSSKESPADFFTLLNQEKDSLVPELGDRSVVFLQASTQEAYRAYRAGRGTEEQLAILRKPFSSLLKKEAAALSGQASAQRRVNRAEEELNAAVNLAATLEAELIATRADLAQLKEQKPLAEADLSQKKAIYLPLKAQMEAQEKRVDAAAKLVKRIEAEISRNESLIARNQREIRALESERSELQSAIPGLEREVRSLESEFSNADSNYSRYNPSYELDRILDSDWAYRSAKRDLESKERELRQAESDYRSAEYRANDALRRLNDCRSRPDQNCSSQESEFNSALRERDSLRSKENQLRSEISSREWRIRSIGSEADSKVRSEQDRLRRIRDDFSSALRAKRDTLSSYRYRIEEIRDLIPTLRRQIEKAKDALPTLAQELLAAENALAQTIAERDAFARQIGFDVAEQNYRATTTRLEEISRGIAARTKALPSLEKKFASAKKAVPPAEKSLAQTRVRLSSANQALATIQVELKPLREQESVLVAKLAEEKSRFKLNQAIYQDLYRELTR
jgi:chromosome segregation ATPase